MAIHTVLLLVTLLSVVAAFTQSFCSSDNTGAVFQATNLYMSAGLCHDSCNTLGYSLAVVQSQSCWCTNSVPSDTVDTSECSVACPGYPLEECGNASDGLYGYVVVKDVYSTAQRSQTQTTTSSSSGTTTGTTTSPTSSTTKTSSSTSPSTSTSTSISAFTSETSTPTSTSDTASATSQSTQASAQYKTSIVYSIMTVTGSATTALTTTQVVSTILNLPLNSSHSSSSGSGGSHGTQNKSFFDYPGKVAGVFTVVGLVVVALIVCVVYFCLRYRKQHTDEDEEAGSSHHEKHTPSLQHEPMVEREDEQRDERLEPVMMSWDQNGSKMSLDDNVDYTRRVLRVVN